MCWSVDVARYISAISRQPRHEWLPYTWELGSGDSFSFADLESRVVNGLIVHRTRESDESSQRTQHQVSRPRRPRSVWSLAQNAATLPLGCATPHAVIHPVFEGIREARTHHGKIRANLLRLLHADTVVRKEQSWLHGFAFRQGYPCLVSQTDYGECRSVSASGERAVRSHPFCRLRLLLTNGGANSSRGWGAMPAFSALT